jgi:RimJ/RimL family protein N-acetyltransferase
MTENITIPQGEITIRNATPEDAASLLELRLEALSLHPEAFAADVEKTVEDGAQAWVERITEYNRDKSGAIIIACAGVKLVGMNGIVRGHWPKTRHSGTLWGVYVTPAWRGLHIGEAIVNGCVEWAIENSLTVVTLGVIIANIPAIRCYSHCGFTIYGVQPKVTRYNGIYYDDLLMVKLL